MMRLLSMFSAVNPRFLLCGSLALLACGDAPFSAGDPEPPTNPPAQGKSDDLIFAAGDAVEVCNVSSGLNLRAGPGTDHAVLAVLAPGARGTVVDRALAWYRLEVEGATGWAHGTYLCPTGTSEPTRLSPGALLGTVWNTYYYLAEESLYPSTGDEALLYDATCQPVARVSAAFSDALCVEGSGRLADGTVLSFARTCSCGRRCPTGGTVCYEQLSHVDYPWGRGSGGRPLIPLRSLAVDRSLLALGSTVYLAEWDGFEVPGIGSLGGFVHDGCFRADDVGGWVENNHIDLFSGTRAMRSALERDHPTNSRWSARRGGERCAHLAP
jgi:3D (Asp-Asp-Asp) domain-containing protein